MSSPSERGWLSLVLASALVTRLVMLASRPIWYDEAFSLLLARRPVADILSGTAADTMPPLYYLLLRTWQSISHDIAFDRSLNVVLGMALVVVVYLWIKDLAGPKEGLWAAAFTAVSPLAVYHAQELRMYTLLSLAVVCNWYGFNRLFGEGRVAGGRGRWWGLFVVSGVAGMYTHNLAVFSLAVPDVLLMLRREWRGLKGLLAAQLGIGLLAGPWLMVVPQQIGKIQAAFWTPQPGILEIVQALVKAHTFLPLPTNWIPLALLSTLLVLSFGALEFAHAKGLGWAKIDLVVAALLPPTLLFGLSYVMRPVFVPRAFLPSVLAYLGVLGIAVTRARRSWVGWGLAAVMLAASLGGLSQQYIFSSFPRSPFPQASEWLRSQLETGDVIVHDNKLSFFPMEIYSPKLRMVFLADEPGSHNDTLAVATQDALGLHPVPDIASAADGANRIWFVTFQRALDEYRAQGRPDHPVLVWLDRRYEKMGEMRFNDLLVYSYRKAQ
jgi:mannosyltransferase